MILSLRNISKSYLQRGLVLDNLALDVSEGDTIAVMGPSGSGKSTLMNLIGLLDKPESGTILFRGTDVIGYTENESAEYRSRNIGFVFQEHLLLPHLTVEENIFLPLLAMKQNSSETQEKIEHAISLMNRTGIANLSGKYPGTISGGEAQRTALVRALVNNPSILLADEPTGSLDSRNADLMGELLFEMNKESGITLILATHSEKLAGKMARTMILLDGKLS